MKQVVRTMVVVLLLASLNLSSAVAQYAYRPSDENPFQLDNQTIQATTPITLTRGQKLTDVGRTLLFSSAAFALMGAAHDAYIGFMGYDGSSPIEYDYGGGLPIATIAGFEAAVFAGVVSVPFLIAGKAISKNEGSEPLVFDDDYRGFKTIIETGLGAPYVINIDAVHGYYLTNNLFLGVGAGFDCWDSQVVYFDGMKPSFNLYGNARIALGNKRISPYFSGSFGYNFSYRESYTGLEFGIRIRQLKRNNSPLWVGIKGKYASFDPIGFALNCSWSF